MYNNEENMVFIIIAIAVSLLIGVLISWYVRDNAINTYICEQVYKNDVQTYKKCMEKIPYDNLQKMKLEKR